MPQLPIKPPDFRRGQSEISASVLNQVIAMVLRQIRGGQSTNVGYYGDRVTINSDQVVVPHVDIQDYVAQFVVLGEEDDCLVCTPFYQPVQGNLDPMPGQYAPQVYDPTLGTSSIVRVRIAKPYELQRSPWDGQTVGSAIDFSGQPVGQRLYGGVQQNISPAYLPGDIIFATRSVSGYQEPQQYDDYTDSYSGSYGGSYSGTGQKPVPIAWNDVNTAARKWDYDWITKSGIKVANINPDSGPWYVPELDFNKETGVQVDSNGIVSLILAGLTQEGAIGTTQTQQLLGPLWFCTNTSAGATPPFTMPHWSLVCQDGGIAFYKSSEGALTSPNAAITYGPFNNLNFQSKGTVVIVNGVGGVIPSSLQLKNDYAGTYMTFINNGVINIAFSNLFQIGEISNVNAITITYSVLAGTGAWGFDLNSADTPGPSYSIGAGTYIGQWGTIGVGATISGGIVTNLGTASTTISGYGITDLMSGSYYTASTPSDWAGSPPTTIQAALDRIAAAGNSNIWPA